ncbi:MAG: menaquinone-dependent protoporphyrinogen IX dehydrogenase [Propionibacteriaceae bacterium]|jgi:menaquinone-dependent protoporphyrinogen oxidase|nr:menaquinone-dependent protoporphyrinogen IX dehydrogenase [Propionibacteriaceae bacterium]
MSILIIHGSRFGQSTKIARAIQTTLESAGLETEFAELGKATDPTGHEGVVLVTSVRYGYFDKNAYRMIARHREFLDSVPTLLVTVSLTARKPEKRDPAVHTYTRKFLAKSGWTPTHTEVVAGALEYPRYNLFDRKAIQLIMRISKGPLDPTLSIEYTDWDQVEAAASGFAKQLA